MAIQLLGIPLWAWITGGTGAAIGGTYVAGRSAEQMGDAAVQFAGLADATTKLVLVTGGAFIAYQVVKAIK